MFRRGFGILWLLLTVLIAAGVGVAAYQAGLATHVPAAGAGAAYPYYGFAPFWAFGIFGLFHLFGLLFFLLLVFLLLRFAVFGRGRGGPGGWQGGPPEAMRERMRERFEEMHRRAHGEEPPAQAT
jgi:hypothetical protein